MRTLVLDIETSPNLGLFWGLWNQDISLSQLLESTEVLCFAAKWHGEKKVRFFKGDDVVEAAWDLLGYADAVVHYNGRKFDIPHLNREFAERGLGPPSPFKQVDLLSVVRKRFKLPSYKLQYVARWLELPGKLDAGGMETWKGVMNGDDKAWRQMEKYNRQDVVLTEQVYDRLMGWIDNHPSHALYNSTLCCTNCGSSNFMKRGFAYTKVSKFQQYQCHDCGKYFRGTSRIEGVPITEVVL